MPPTDFRWLDDTLTCPCFCLWTPTYNLRAASPGFGSAAVILLIAFYLHLTRCAGGFLLSSGRDTPRNLVCVCVCVCVCVSRHLLTRVLAIIHYYCRPTCLAERPTMTQCHSLRHDEEPPWHWPWLRPPHYYAMQGCNGNAGRPPTLRRLVWLHLPGAGRTTTYDRGTWYTALSLVADGLGVCFPTSGSF